MWPCRAHALRNIFLSPHASFSPLLQLTLVDTKSNLLSRGEAARAVATHHLISLVDGKENTINFIHF